MERTMIQCYTGDGKGKTTAAIGLAARAAGHGLSVVFIQLMKADVTSQGEYASLTSMPGVRVLRYGQSLLDHDRQPARVAAALREGLAEARRLLQAGDVDVLVLDEANVACALGLITPDEVLFAISAAGPGVEIVLTGRGAPELLIDHADLVTEMVARKHPFDTGTDARKGIEY